MKLISKLAVVMGASLVLSGCTIPFIPGKAGVQIASNPQGTVFIDNKSVGKTLVYQDNTSSGSHTVKIVPLDTSYQAWEGKVELTPGTLTVIERQLAVTADQASGYTLSFDKIKDKNSTEVNVVGIPTTISVLVDGSPMGFTPLDLDSVIAGAHTFTFTAPGYQEKTVKANVQNGYKLLISVQLAANQTLPTPTPTLVASDSAQITPTPTTTAIATEITPLAKQSSAAAALVTTPYVEILTTPTGWLKVRDTSSPSGNEIAKVNPGDRFPYISTVGSWFQIEYQTGSKGWVSNQYARLVQ